MDFANGAPSPLDNVINRIYLQTTLRSHTFQFFVSIITSIFSVIDTILIGIGIDLPAAYRRMGYILGGIGGRLAGLVGAGPKGSKEDYELQSESGTDDGIVEGHSSALDATKGTRKLKMRRSVPAETEIIGSNYPGMVNLSGTLCYMNSVLQAFASLPRLHEHLESVIEIAEDVDLATPVTDALISTLDQLNTPSTSSYPPPIRPVALINAFSSLPSVRRLLQTRDHQDAHELFLLLASAISDELSRLSKERRRDLGFAAPNLSLPTTHSRLPSSSGWNVYGARVWKGSRKGKEKEIMSPFDGLSANRRSCLKCGWCEAIRYETLGALDVAVPMSGRIRLESCLEYFTNIEIIDDAHCDACTLKLTLAYYTSEAQRLTLPSGDPPVQPSASKRKRAREARKVEKILQGLLEDKAISGMEKVAGLEEIKWVRGRSKSAKQAMIARPPQILGLHLVRSEYTPYGQIVKKTPFVNFPPILDITDFTTSGSLYMDADGPISRHATPEFQDARSTISPPNAPGETPPRVLYRLQALICHYGFTHSFGHFVAYRRKPSSDRPKKACPDYCECQDCAYYGQVRGEDISGWLRISDADVENVSESQVLSEQGSSFLLFYEKVLEWDGVDRKRRVEEMDGKEPSGGTVSALMEEMKRKGGSEAMKNAWATTSKVDR